jgi:GST-like protein
VLNRQLARHEYILGAEYSIVDMSAWGWLGRARFVLPGSDDPLSAFPHLQRLLSAVDARPAAQRARSVGKDHAFKKELDEEARRALYPSNYPPLALPG